LNNLLVIKSLLSKKGYIVKVEQEENLKDTELYVLYATRTSVNTISKGKKIII